MEQTQTAESTPPPNTISTHETALIFSETLSENYVSVHAYDQLIPEGSPEDLEALRDKALITVTKQDELMRDFYGDTLNQQAYDAAILFPLLKIDPNQKDKLIEFTKTYYSKKNGRYACGLLLDSEIIDSFLDQHTKDQSIDYSTTGSHWIDSHQQPIKPMEWVELIQQTDIAAIAIKAVQLLTSLEEDAPASKETFQAIDAAERLYAPLCEILGIDGLAMTLRSRANILRLVHSGNSAYVDEARTRLHIHSLSALDDDNPHKYADHVITEIGFENLNESAVPFSDSHRTMIGHGELEYKHNGETHLARYVYREKSVGSLAMKLFRNNPKDPKKAPMPMDIMGYTIIISDQDEIGPVALTIANHIQNNPNLKFRASPSRDHAIHVSGSQEYRNHVFREPKDWEGQFVDIPKNPADFEVTKVTFVSTVEVDRQQHELLCEVQILTEDQRERTRIDEISHIIFKLKQQYEVEFSKEELKSFSEALREIHEQKPLLGKVVLSPTSYERVKTHFISNRNRVLGSKAMNK